MCCYISSKHIMLACNEFICTSLRAKLRDYWCLTSQLPANSQHLVTVWAINSLTCVCVGHTPSQSGVSLCVGGQMWPVLLKYKIIYHFIFSFVSVKVEVLGAFMDDKFFFFDSQLCHKDRKLWSCDPALISFFPPMFSCRWKRTRLGLPIMRKEDRVWIIFKS